MKPGFAPAAMRNPVSSLLASLYTIGPGIGNCLRFRAASSPHPGDLVADIDEGGRDAPAWLYRLDRDRVVGVRGGAGCSARHHRRSVADLQRRLRQHEIRAARSDQQE